MDRLLRVYKLHQILRSSRKPVSMRELQAKLECSQASIKRIIRDLRLYFEAPIEYDHDANGYRCAANGEHPFELPGLWFSAGELHALLAADKLLADLQPGLFEGMLMPLRKRIREILAAGKSSPKADLELIRVLSMAARQGQQKHFQTIASALLQRQRLAIGYYNRAKDEHSEREVSPQRLTHYRDNWYLDAWCHKAQALRCFALDAIEAARLSESTAQDIPSTELDAHFAAGYGIFAGPATATAVLRFTPERARWVARESWHPRQEGHFLPDGRYELSFPYSDPRELVMDILKYGPEVEVVAPEALRREVVARLSAALTRYTG